jgi:hypothetical protein
LPTIPENIVMVMFNPTIFADMFAVTCMVMCIVKMSENMFTGEVHGQTIRKDCHDHLKSKILKNMFMVMCIAEVSKYMIAAMLDLTVPADMFTVMLHSRMPTSFFTVMCMARTKNIFVVFKGQTLQTLWVKRQVNGAAGGVLPCEKWVLSC